MLFWRFLPQVTYFTVNANETITNILYTFTLRYNTRKTQFILLREKNCFMNIRLIYYRCKGVYK